MRFLVYLVLLVLPLTTWFLLKDIKTSHGGYWHYFWPLWAITIGGMIFMEIFAQLIERKGKE